MFGVTFIPVLAMQVSKAHHFVISLRARHPKRSCLRGSRELLLGDSAQADVGLILVGARKHVLGGFIEAHRPVSFGNNLCKHLLNLLWRVWWHSVLSSLPSDATRGRTFAFANSGRYIRG